MPNVPVENLGKLGLYVDPRPYELLPEAFNRADNVRFSNIGAEVVEGQLEVYTENAPTFTANWLKAWPSSSGFSWILAGGGKLGRFVGTAFTDVTRSVGGDYALAQWRGTLLGDLPIANNEGTVDYPQGWDGTRFLDLTNWPATTYCKFLSVYERFVIAYKVTKSGVYNARMVKWSEPADPGTYPNSWDETDPSLLTGEVTLADSPGDIITTEILATYNLIYKEDSVTLMRYVGGQNIFSFDTLFSDFGALSHGSVVAWANKHFVITNGDVVVHDGHTYESIINERNRKFLFENIHAAYTDLTLARLYERENEIWICYADVNSSGKLNKALTWNYTNNSWGYKDLDDLDHIAYGYVDTTTISSIYDDLSETYSAWLEPYDAQSASPVLDDLLAVKGSDGSFHLQNSSRTLNGVAIPVRLERTGLAIVGRDRQGQPKIDLDSRKFIRRVHPKLRATGEVTFYVGGQETPEGAVTWVGPYTYNASIQSFFDCRVNTKFFCIRLESEADIFWQLLGYTLDLDVIGEAPR